MASTSSGSQRRLALAALFCLTLMTVLFLQFRAQIFNGFTVLYGDRYDAAIVATIMEHWSSVVRGDAMWSQLNYFYPYTRTLGQTDGMFLVGMVYSAVRLLGFDPFLTGELTNVVFRVIGFAGFFLCGRQMFRLPFWSALLGAALFVLANNLTVHGQRVQLTTLGLAPILALLMWHSLQALYAGRQRRFAGYGVASGILLGAWSITCFYMTWFFIFFTIFVFAFLLVGATAAQRRELGRTLARQKAGVLAVVLATIASLLPLLTVYLPKSRETGMRPIETVLGNTVPLQGILQVGNENLLFGKIYNRFLSFVTPGYAPNGEYYNTGIAPLLFLLFVFGCVLVLRASKREEAAAGAVAGQAAGMPLLRAVCAATILTWLLTLNIGGYSAWWLVYKVFPGARALSVVSAYQIFLTFPVLVVAMHYLSAIRMRLAMLAVVVALLCLEELNDAYIALVRSDEVARVSVPPPPPQCAVFFAAGWTNQAKATPMPDWINTFYAHNVTAMLVAELHQIPTINGIASFNPPDWSFDKPNDPDYLQRIRQYAQRHKVSGLCRLDPVAKRWDVQW